MSVYRCPANQNDLEVWHLGHMPAPVAEGTATRAAIFDGPSVPREQERQALQDVDAEIRLIAAEEPTHAGAIRMRRLLSRRTNLAECLRDCNYIVPELEVNGVKL